jgi:hypothetical protein
LSLSALVGGAEATTENETFAFIEETGGFLNPVTDSVSRTIKAETDANNSVGTITLSYESERYNASLEASSSTNASGNGYQTNTEKLVGRFDYKFSERLRFNSRLTWGENTEDDNTPPRFREDGTIIQATDNDRTYTRASLGLTYRLAEDWLIRSNYSYNETDRDSEDGTADSNAFYISLVYKPTKKMWSR